MRARGFSLIELVVIIAIIAVIMVGVIALTGRTFQISRNQVEQGRITEEAQVEIDRMAELIRGARNLDCDANRTPDRPEEFWLQTAEGNRLTFYSNADNDEQPERVTYAVTNTTLEQQVDELTGGAPCSFTTGTSRVLSYHVRNGNNSLFAFVEEDGSTLEAPVLVTAVVRVLIDLSIDVSTISPVGPLPSVLPPTAAQGACAPVDNPSVFGLRTTDELEMEEPRPATRQELAQAQEYLEYLATYDDRQAMVLSSDERYLVFTAQQPWRLFGQRRYVLYHLDRQEQLITEVSMVRGDWSFVPPTISDDGRYVATREYNWDHPPLSDRVPGCVWRYDVVDRSGIVVARPSSERPYSLSGLVGNPNTEVTETRMDMDAMISPDGSHVAFAVDFETRLQQPHEVHLYLWNAATTTIEKLTEARYPEARNPYGYGSRGRIVDIRWNEPDDNRFTFFTRDPRTYIHSQNEVVDSHYQYDTETNVISLVR